MDPELLVDERIEDGRSLLTRLDGLGFDVSIAAWVKTSDEGLWHFYIGSTSVKSGAIGDAYQILHTCLFKMPEIGVSFSEVRFIEATNPIAKDAMEIRDRRPGRRSVRFHGERLGNLFVEDAYIYPRVEGQMTTGEILRALVDLTDRAAGPSIRPFAITLRDGSTVKALVTGFDLQLPAALTIHTFDPAANCSRSIGADDVILITG